MSWAKTGEKSNAKQNMSFTMRSKKFGSFARPISQGLQKASSKVFRGEKVTGYKGQISPEAKKLLGRVELIKANIKEFLETDKATRRENKHEIMEDLEFVLDHAIKIESTYKEILTECEEKLAGGDIEAPVIEPVNTKQRNKTQSFLANRKSTSSNADFRRSKITNIKKQPAPKKVQLMRKTNKNSSHSSFGGKTKVSSRRSMAYSLTITTSKEKKYRLIYIKPLQAYLKILGKLVETINKILNRLNREILDKEIKIKHKGSVSGVYNEHTGQVEWREETSSGVCGVYNPFTKEIEWRKRKGYGVHGVYNEVTRKVEWRYYRNGSVYGVWNPVKKDIHWKESYREGVCGVWHPILEEVVFKTFRKGSIVGWFDESEQDIIWRRKLEHGISVIRKRPKPGTNFEFDYESITSNYCDWQLRNHT